MTPLLLGKRLLVIIDSSNNMTIAEVTLLIMTVSTRLSFAWHLFDQNRVSYQLTTLTVIN